MKPVTIGISGEVRIIPKNEVERRASSYYEENTTDSV
jgi:hypothetical protein